MAFTYAWTQAIELLKAYGRNIPIDKMGPQICDSVSSEIWSAFPWRDTCQTIPVQALSDNEQDYSVPPTVFKLVSGQIIRTGPTTQEYEPITVVENLPYNCRAHPQFIRQFSLERGVGLMRLSYRPAVGATEAFELRGTYQMQHRRITDISQDCWFKDQLWHVAQEGLLYWGYKLADSPGRAEKQYRLFRTKIIDAWNQEDAGSADNVHPEDGSIGVLPNSGY